MGKRERKEVNRSADSQIDPASCECPMPMKMPFGHGWYVFNISARDFHDAELHTSRGHARLLNSRRLVYQCTSVLFSDNAVLVLRESVERKGGHAYFCILKGDHLRGVLLALAAELVGHIEFALVVQLAAVRGLICDPLPLGIRLREVYTREMLGMAGDTFCRA